MWNEFLDFIFPPTCLVCGKRWGLGLDRGSSVVCSRCDPLAMPYLDDLVTQWNSELLTDPSAHQLFCDRCGEVTTSWGTITQPRLCVPCVLWPPPFRRVRSLWRYANQVAELIKAYKYRTRRPLAKYITAVVATALQGTESHPPLFPEHDWELIVPLPSSDEMLRQRGFNHMGQVARALSRKLGIPNTVAALTSSRNRAPQVSLIGKARYDNVTAAFQVNESIVSGRVILVLDDVMTTGASVWGAASALNEAGASAIDVLTVARAVDFHHQRLSRSKEQRAIVQELVENLC